MELVIASLILRAISSYFMRSAEMLNRAFLLFHNLYSITKCDARRLLNNRGLVIECTMGFVSPNNSAGRTQPALMVYPDFEFQYLSFILYRMGH